MNYSSIALIALILLNISASQSNTQFLNLQPVISENFDDGYLDGWIIKNRPTGDVASDGGNVTVSNGTMVQENWKGLAAAYIQSNVQFGTWSIDLLGINGSQYAGIDFINTGLITGRDEPDAIGFQVDLDDLSFGPQGYDLYNFKRNEYFRLGHVEIAVPIETWVHLDVTFSKLGNLAIYANKILALNATIDVFFNPKYIVLWTWTGKVIFDNLKVYDELILDAIPPQFNSSLSDQHLRSGQTLKMQIPGVDDTGIMKWSVNDTTMFSIDDTGLITSKGRLETGIYGIEVQLEDQFGNSLTGRFDVIVQSNYDIYGGMGFITVITTILVWFKRRRAPGGN